MRRKRLLALSLSVAGFATLMLVGWVYTASAAQGEEEPDPGLYNAAGVITLLRVHDLGTGFGGGTDFLDGEVVIRLDSQPGMAFGFQLRNDDDRPAREGMLALLRDAFNHDWIVNIDFWIVPGKTNGRIIRVWLTKPEVVEDRVPVLRR